METDPPKQTPVQRLHELDGKISWTVWRILEDALFELSMRGPSERTEAAINLWSTRLRQLRRLSDRLKQALESRERYGPQSRRRDTRRSGPKEPSRPGPQTLGEYVLQKCGTQSEEWKDYIRLKQLFGVPRSNDTPSY